MKMIFFKKTREKAEEFGISFWKMPETLLILSALLNIFVMIGTYYWASNIAEDPREAVLIVALESIMILVISNIIVESAERIIDTQKLKREFVSIISHQIRSPLTNIHWSLEILKRKKNEGYEVTEKYLNRIAESSKRITNLADNFIHLSRIDEKVKFKKEKIDLVKIVEKIVASNSLFAHSHHVKVVFKQINKEVLVNSNRESLRIIIENLIENAIKYCSEGGTVEILIKKNEGNTIFQVSNEGLGISNNEKEFIFKKFYRTKEAKLIFPHGTGLGLYMSKSLLQKLGGKIWFESKLNRKTTFFVELPKT